MSTPARPIFEFGSFRLDPNEQRLLRAGEPVPLTPKAFELLLCLVEHAGQLLTKEELLASVWPDAFVEEAVLSVNMSTVRKALGDDRNGHSFIETAPRRGYRFIAPVRRIEPATASVLANAPAITSLPSNIATNVTKPKRQWMRWVMLAAVVATVLVSVQSGRKILMRRALGTSVAVLPLKSLSDDPEQQHFADAMTDLLLTNLGQIPRLQVVSLQSVSQYKQTQKTVPQIARELKVDCIVEGTVRREGDRVRITAQLIHGPTDRHLWAETYERSLADTFALQQQVAESIAREIGVKLAPAEHSSQARYVIPAAHEAYLRGVYLLQAGESEKAIAEFRKAVAVDPKYNRAYTKMATTYFDLAIFNTMPPYEAFPNAKEAALKALENDPNDAEAHASLAVVKLHYEWDWTGAEREFRRSLELNPSDADVRHTLAHYLLTVGRSQESLTEMDRAFQNDPVGLLTAT